MNPVSGLNFSSRKILELLFLTHWLRFRRAPWVRKEANLLPLLQPRPDPLFSFLETGDLMDPTIRDAPGVLRHVVPKGAAPYAFVASSGTIDRRVLTARTGCPRRAKRTS
jgi:hypothetical protein